MENKRFDLRLKRAIYDIPGRNYGIELLRIVAMLFICILHVCNTGGITSHVSASSSPDKYRTAWFFEALTYCAVNIFGMISGYVGYNKKPSVKRPLEIWLELVFYTLLCTLLISVFTPELLQENAWFKSAFPVLNGEYWYMTAFFGMIILSPLLNIAVQKADLKTLGATVGAIFVMFSVLPTAMKVSPFGLGSGYSALWLCVMYVFGGFIARIKKPHPLISLSGFVFSVVMTWLLDINGVSGVLKYTSPTVILSAASLLCTMCRLEIKKPAIRKLIGFIAPSTLGIYIIHVHTFFWDNFLKDAAVPFTKENAFIMGLLILAGAAGIFTFCFAVDLIRRGLFYLLRVKPLLQKLEQSVAEIFEKKAVSKETG